MQVSASEQRNLEMLFHAQAERVGQQLDPERPAFSRV